MTAAWYSGARHIPPELPLNRWQRKAIAAEAQMAWMRHGKNGPKLFASLMLLLIGMICGLVVLYRLHRSHGWMDLSTAFIMVWICGSSLMLWCWRERTLPGFVFAELRARGHDVCLGCGYVRHGLNTDAGCPECGAVSRPG